MKVLAGLLLALSLSCHSTPPPAVAPIPALPGGGSSAPVNPPVPVPIVPAPSPFPSAPSRTDLLNVRMTFQGLTVQTAEFGPLPWFDTALESLTAADRQAVYAAKHVAGDDHVIIQFDDNTGSIYNENGQPYQQMIGRGFESNPGAFVDLVKEVRQNGFLPLVFLGGDDGSTCSQNPVPPQCGWVIATRELPIAVAALKTAQPRDLSLDVCFVPGYDGVFYGWTPAQLTTFGQNFRALLPSGCLGLEHQPGKIPIGNGPADYGPGGAMQAYDLILDELQDGNLHQDSTWQIAGRLLGPFWKRPADMPVNDDPRPPCYTCPGTSRGPYQVCAFEFGEYEWVRNLVTADFLNTERSYLKSLGYSCIN